MLKKQVDHNGGDNNIRYGDSLTNDRFAGRTFDYFLTNPPFGVDWKKQRAEIRREHEKEGFAGRFGVGLPRVSDGSLLFLQHMAAKFERVATHEHKHGSRLAIVFSGSPLFAGGAGSGESGIRQWLIENDWLEAIVALPEQMFYNTGIGTYVWIVTNRKVRPRRGKIQIVDAHEIWTPGGGAEITRSLGNKCRHIADGQTDEIVCLYSRFENDDRSKIFVDEDFGYTRVTGNGGNGPYVGLENIEQWMGGFSTVCRRLWKLLLNATFLVSAMFCSESCARTLPRFASRSLRVDPQPKALS